MLSEKTVIWRRVSLWLGGMLLLVATITSLLPEYAPPGQYNADKFIHISFYCLFTFLWLFSLPDRSWTKCLTAAMAVFLYGALLELLQQYVGSRTMSVADIGVNGLGITLAILINVALRSVQIAHRKQDG